MGTLYYIKQFLCLQNVKYHPSHKINKYGERYYYKIIHLPLFFSFLILLLRIFLFIFLDNF